MIEFAPYGVVFEVVFLMALLLFYHRNNLLWGYSSFRKGNPYFSVSVKNLYKTYLTNLRIARNN